MKKFITIALAVAVLFSFAACQQPTYKNIDTISIAQKDIILDGETVTPDMFEVTANYTDGTSGVISAAIDLSQANVASATVTSYGKEFKANTDIKLTSIEGVEVSGLSNVSVKAGTQFTALEDLEAAYNAGTISWEGEPVVTLSYDGGSKEYGLFDIDYVLSVYDANGNMLGSSNAFVAGGTYTVKMEKVRFTKDAGDEWAKIFTPAVDLGIEITVPAAADPVTVDGIKVYYSVNGGDKVETLPALYAKDSVTITVYETYSDDTEKATTGTVTAINTTTGTAPQFTGATTTTAVTVATSSSSVTTTVEGTLLVKIGDDYYQAPYSVGAGASYFTVSSLAIADATATGITAPHAFVAADVKATITWTGTEGTPQVTYSFDNSAVPAGFVGTFQTLCTATWIERGETKTLTMPLSYTVNAQ